MKREDGLLDVAYNPKQRIFVVFDPDFNDYVAPEKYEKRRIWYHVCREAGIMQYTENVTSCGNCGLERPKIGNLG